MLGLGRALSQWQAVKAAPVKRNLHHAGFWPSVASVYGTYVDRKPVVASGRKVDREAVLNQSRRFVGTVYPDFDDRLVMCRRRILHPLLLRFPS